jgi:hypothetical protein
MNKSIKIIYNDGDIQSFVGSIREGDYYFTVITNHNDLIYIPLTKIERIEVRE